jgi:hypothetical protein
MAANQCCWAHYMWRFIFHYLFSIRRFYFTRRKKRWKSQTANSFNIIRVKVNGGFEKIKSAPDNTHRNAK